MGQDERENISEASLELTIAQATIFNAITGRPPATTPKSIWNSIWGQDTEEKDMMRTLAAYVILNEKDRAKQLIQKRPSLLTTAHGRTKEPLLFYSIKFGNVEMTLYLLAVAKLLNIDLESIQNTETGNTLLHASTDPRIINFLLNYDINLLNRSTTRAEPRCIQLRTK